MACRADVLARAWVRSEGSADWFAGRSLVRVFGKICERSADKLQMILAMNSSDAALWLSALVNMALAGLLAVHLRRQVRSRIAKEAKAKTAYSRLCAGVGVLSGFAVFPGATTLLDLPVGHGEVLIAAPLLHLLLSGLLIVAGRIYIGWIPIKW